jgi:hypothetical protein
MFLTRNDDSFDISSAAVPINAVSTLSDETRMALVAALCKAFESYVADDGLVFPMEAHVVVRTK